MESCKGKLEAIWIKRFRKGPMDPVESARALALQGLEGNANLGGKRQITVVEQEVMEQLQAHFGESMDPILRRANLMISGVSLTESRGRILRVGDLRIEIWGETRPCERMDEALPGLRKALDPDWRGGVYGIVLNDCRIRVGDAVYLE